jgi:hypothetical protein
MDRERDLTLLRAAGHCGLERHSIANIAVGSNETGGGSDYISRYQAGVRITYPFPGGIRRISASSEDSRGLGKEISS